MNIIIRQEQIEDYTTTEKIVQTAFKGMELSDEKEHELVARIRRSEVFIPALSLVAVHENTKEIIGHILLSELKIVNQEHAVQSLVLAPVSVLPEYQNEGIGKRLINEALNKARELGYQSVVVLGHPEYYPKFGFEKTSLYGIKPPFEVPDEAFMVLPLEEHALDNVSGVVEYPSVFFE
ncbi:MAG: N-acetyltransferase [Lysinibacillus sp.]